ncbi:HAMP domain-containing protein [Leptolyngbya cf. ectocarpi LEGE 11479]|uniref:HAMP domain-containing protein n=1 Tax=Leptolyngbya cf. ectocarpi LEGE 11479 TaxID=1828722 RepID=A0A929FB89_LEPEC|nr:HAMP domain-containing methyl-accepting chemotaxis protein [Leptolyngbya ectocarpi]MBE9068498.1 HAMP domain-containing protein [Leptolyngbya cf. ectocarpi LEGE 11479]
MTAKEYSLNDQLQRKEATSPQKQLFRTLGANNEKGRPLGRQLLQTLLPVTLLPLAVASGLGIVITKNAENEDVLFALKQEAFLASEASGLFVEDSFSTVENLVISPNIQQLLNQANQKAAEDELIDQPVEALEQQFAQTKLLTPNGAINKYLADITAAEELGELFLTESNGLTVAVDSPITDFVQSDEDWWLQSKQFGQYVEPVKFDDSANVVSVSLSRAITPVGSEEFLGVVKSVLPQQVLSTRIANYLSNSLGESQSVQVIDVRNGLALATVPVVEEGAGSANAEVVGGEIIAQFAQALSSKLGRESDSPQLFRQELAQATDARILDVSRTQVDGREVLEATVSYDGRNFSLATVTDLPWVAISSEDAVALDQAGLSLLIVFILTAIVLGTASGSLLLALARRLSQPLQTLTEVAQKAAAGDLDARASIQGTFETQILGRGFNNLLEQLQSLLKQQKEAADEQREEREKLENDITQLMEEVGDAADGDLSVRAKLSAGDVGIVADLFNAIIENLRDIAVNVKQSTGQVSGSLLTNEQQILAVVEQAVEEARSMQTTMVAVEEMGQSIQTVAQNANQASSLTNDTYVTVQAGSESMEKTANSILELRSTVGETAKKIKRLGESAQKIAQSVSLIDEIALKTNLLAVNASVEASRAGELGQGFTAVAEQVGSLAEQSANATKTIAQIVADIQTETQEVVTAIETGTAQVVDSSTLVKLTQQQLEQVLTKSEQINRLMQNISDSTVNQNQASVAVTELIQKSAQSSQERSQASAQMAQAIQETAKVAQSLQASVEQFKVEE